MTSKNYREIIIQLTIKKQLNISPKNYFVKVLLLTYEMSGLKTDRDNMVQSYKEVKNGTILSAIRTEADVDSTI